MEVLKKVNKYIFLFLVGLAVVTFAAATYMLSIPSDAPDAGQSKLGFYWTMFHTVFLLVLVSFIFFVHKFWDKLFPANIPFAIILLGFSYFFICNIFMVGWAFFIGLTGGFVGLMSGIALLIVNYIWLLIHQFRGTNE